MTLDLGNVDASTVLYIPFHTFNSSGASVTISGLAVTDIEIYKNGSTTTRASDNGYTLLDTDGIDFASKTGIHGFSIDLSDNSDAGFYAAGSFYWVVVSAITVDSQTVSFVAATFRIGPAAANVTQLLGTAWATPATAGLTDVNVKQISTDATAADNAELFFDGTGYAGTNNVIPLVTTTTTATNVTTVNGLAANVITAASMAADASAEIADAVWDEDATGHQTQGTFGQAIGDPVADANTIFKATVTDATGATVGVDSAAIITTLGVAGAGLTDLGGMSTTMKAQVEAEVDDALGGPGTGTALTAIPWNAAWDTEVQSEVDDALVAQNLDHLVKIAVDTNFATTVHLDSVIGHLADAGTTATFDRTTDALEVLQAEHDATQSALATAQTDISAILVDTGTTLDGRIPAALVGGRMDSNVGAISTDATAADNAEAFFDGTGYAGTNNVIPLVTTTTTATNLTTNNDKTGYRMSATGVDDILRTALVESYSADGSPPTLSQFAFIVMQRLTEFAISGTTITVKKLDGSTTALTLTLDSSTTPTSSTRAS